MRYFREAILTLLVLIALALAIFPPAALTADQALTFGIVLITLGIWATGLAPGYLASLFLFTALLLCNLAAPDLVFAGFTSSAMWLVVTGAVIGTAITKTGMGDRIGALARPHLSKSYPVLISGLMLMGMALGFVMPSSIGRAAVILPVAMALAEAIGFEPGSRGRIGLAVIIAFGTNMPSFAILPSNIPNIVLAGLTERTLGMDLSYGAYLLLHYPVLGLVKSALLVLLVLRFFPAKITGTPPEIAPDTAPLARKRQGLLMGILLATILLWATDQLHGINPAWVGLGATTLLLIPRLGLVPPPAFKGAVDFGTILFVAGALALGGIVGQSGLGAQIAHAVIAVLPLAEGHDFLNFYALSALGALTSVFTTAPAVPAVLTPLAEELAQSTGFSIDTVVMTQVVGFSTVIFPYQVGPLIITMGLAGESTRNLLRITLALAALSLAVLIPLDFLWWKALGWI